MRRHWVAFGIAVGAGIGIIIGVTAGNIELGLALGQRQVWLSEACSLTGGAASDASR
ncbi:MAG: hypothetical protein M3Q31_03820 [Actinomycetota bacterium]|nr:hypothetical protein [Actinomycetota bacterium]